MLGARWSSQASATCIGVAPSRAATSERVEDCRREAAKREEGHIGDAAARQFVYQRVVVAMHEIVMVLHADDLGDAVRLFELGRGHVAQAELSDQALTLKLGQGRKLFLDRALVRLKNAANAQVDHIEDIQSEVPEIVVNGAREVRRGERGNPRRVRAAYCSDLGHDHEVIGIGMKCLANELVGDVRAIVIAGVDVVDSPRDGLAKHGEGRLAILGRAKHPRSGELHGTIAHTVHGAVAQEENARRGDVGYVRSPRFTGPRAIILKAAHELAIFDAVRSAHSCLPPS